MENVRLQKFFTDCGVLSRRAAEEEIRKGLVTVNGVVADIGLKIDPDHDVVKYNGRVIKPTVTVKHYILLYKPRGIVTTLSDEKGRTTVADLVADIGVRVYPVGRLDMDSDGLLLLTDDGALTERLTHPRHEIPKRYHVAVAGVVTPAQLAALNSSFLLDGYTTRPAKVSVVRAESGETVLSFELYEGRNRQIRRMCDQVGLRIRRLTRVAIGRIGIGDLVPGRYRHLNEEEIAYLRGEQPVKTTSAGKATKAASSPKLQTEFPKKSAAQGEKTKKAAEANRATSSNQNTKTSVQVTTKKVLKAIKSATNATTATISKVAKEAKAVIEAKASKDTGKRTGKKAAQKEDGE